MTNDMTNDEDQKFLFNCEIDVKNLNKNLGRVFIKHGVTRKVGREILIAIKNAGVDSHLPTDPRTILGQFKFWNYILHLIFTTGLHLMKCALYMIIFVIFFMLFLTYARKSPKSKHFRC